MTASESGMGREEKVNLLLVDDTASNLTALSAVLNRSDYILTYASSGKMALDLLAHREFALVLLDVVLTHGKITPRSGE